MRQYKTIKEIYGLKSAIQWLIRTNKRAYLRGADLRGADLQGANLQGIKRKDIIICSGVGSEKRQSLYIVQDNYIRCGCFKGTFLEFIRQIKNTYKKDTLFYNQYKLVVLFFYKQKKLLK